MYLVFFTMQIKILYFPFLDICSSNIFTEIKSCTIRWVRNVARIGEMMNSQKVLIDNAKGRGRVEELCVDV